MCQSIAGPVRAVGLLVAIIGCGGATRSGGDATCTDCDAGESPNVGAPLACNADSQAPSPEAPDECLRFAETLCSRESACREELSGPPGDPNDSVARCIDETARQCASIYPLVGSSLDSERLLACTEKVATGDCIRVLGKYRGRSGGGHPGPWACIPGPGTLPEGEPCESAHQCQTEYCDETCLLYPGAIDESSYALWQRVETAGEPPPASSPGTCLNSYLVVVDGLCQLPPEIGEPCFNGRCNELGGATCIEGVCAPIPVAGPSDGCGYYSGSDRILGRCADGLTCVVVSDTGQGRCVPIVELGDECSAPLGGDPCRYPATCIDGVCRAVEQTCG